MEKKLLTESIGKGFNRLIDWTVQNFAQNFSTVPESTCYVPKGLWVVNFEK